MTTSAGKQYYCLQFNVAFKRFENRKIVAFTAPMECQGSVLTAESTDQNTHRHDDDDFEFMMVCPRQKTALWLDPATFPSVS